MIDFVKIKDGLLSPSFRAVVGKKLNKAIHAGSEALFTLRAVDDWQIDFGPTYGEAGTQTTITVHPGVAFRGEKGMFTDSSETAGYGTRVSSVFIGAKAQWRPDAGSKMTAFFSHDAMSDGLKWDVCEKAMSISITVQFVQSCTFDATVFGRAVL